MSYFDRQKIFDFNDDPPLLRNLHYFFLRGNIFRFYAMISWKIHVTCCVRIKSYTNLYMFLLQTFPIGWVLMSKRTTLAYKTVFNEIKQLFLEFKPKVVITDFEKGLRRALKESFGMEDEDIIGCHFHYAQVFLSWLMSNYNCTAIVKCQFL